MNSKAKGVYSIDSQKMTSGYLERRIIDKSLIEGSKERSHQPRSVELDDSAEKSRHLVNSCPVTTPDVDKATFKNRFGIVGHGSRDDLNSSEATDVHIQSEGMANIQNINITNNLGSTIVCGNSEFNFDTKPLKTEVKAKQLNDESLKTVPKQQPLDGKPLDDDQLKHGSFNAYNRSEFCLEEATNSESSCKVYTAHHQPTNINGSCGIVLILTCPMGNQLLTKRNIHILNNFGTILVCQNTEILFNVLSSNSVELTPNNEGIIIFDGKQLRGGQSNTKYGLAKSQNRSEFCLRQAVGLSITEEEVKFEAVKATWSDQPIQIDDNSGIVIILVYSGQHHSNASKATDCEEPAGVENIEVTNNFGNTVVCNDSRVNIDLLSNETIKIMDVHDRSTVPLHQKVMLDKKQLEDRQSEIKISSFNRSEFCQS